MQVIDGCKKVDSAGPLKPAIYNRDELLKIGLGNGPKGFPLLPKPGMLMLDRITFIDMTSGKYGKGQIQGEFDINPDLWFFNSHFENDPIMPGSLGVDGLCQLLGFYLGYLGYCGKGRAIGVGKTRYKDEITPKQQLLSYTIDIKHLKHAQFPFAIADGKIACEGNTVTEVAGIYVGVKK